MSIVAPIAGISAVVPVVFGIATGDRPSAWQWLGIAGALGGVFLASREPGAGGKVAAGVGPRAAGGDRLRRLLPADARRRKRRLLVGVADLPHDLDVGRSSRRSRSGGRRSQSSRSRSRCSR